MSRLITNRRLFVLLASVILLMVIAGLTMRTREREASWPVRVLMDVQNTMTGWIYRPVAQISAFVAGLNNLHELYVENGQLQAEMQNYHSLQAKLQDETAANQTLRMMLHFKQSSANQWQLLPASVVGRDPATWSSLITIDIGTAQGVRSNMAVVAPDGSLVGRIETVATNSSKVLLITDTLLGDGVAAMVQHSPTSQPFGIVQGASSSGAGVGTNELEMSFLSPIAQITPGDTVVTSKLSQVFPQGIVIGTVVNVTQGQQGLTQSAVVRPAANLEYLQDVFVVQGVNTKGKGQ
ncbi:rod shape-determining protein MreC [Alicyclobacillaceae bacterium I2511]|nr:rod shape-determining protein MreC [Alicyclobacillaceae bacterium I2511]